MERALSTDSVELPAAQPARSAKRACGSASKIASPHAPAQLCIRKMTVPGHALCCATELARIPKREVQRDLHDSRKLILVNLTVDGRSAPHIQTGNHRTFVESDP